MKHQVQDAVENDNDNLIPSPTIKKGLDNVLDVLGICLMNAIFEDMWKSGIVFGRNTSYSINQIQRYFEKTLGTSVAKLLINQLKKELVDL